MVKERREKHAQSLQQKRLAEELKLTELRNRQNEEAERRNAKMQLIDAERQDYMRNKEELEKIQRQACQYNKELIEREHENQMKSKLEKIEAKMQSSQNAY